MKKPRFVWGGLLAIAAALALVAAPRAADARVVVGFGIGIPLFPFGYPYYPPPPVVYAPPPAAYGAPVIARCTAANGICPLLDARPVGAPCGCPDAAGRYIPGRAG